MSITDGQWILDMKVFRDTMRPAVNVGLSVSRVGGRGQSDRQKHLGGQMFKTLTSHAQAQEFARFGSELAADAKQDLTRGSLVYKLLNQTPGERYTLMAQTLLLDIALNLETDQMLNVENIKKAANDYAVKVASDADFIALRDKLKAESLMVPAGAAVKPAAVAPVNGSGAEDNKKEAKK